MLYVCFLCLASCGAKKGQWSYDEIKTSCPTYQSKKIYLCPTGGLRSLRIEFVRTSSGTRVYIKIFSLTFPRERNHKQRTQVCISCGLKRYEFDAIRMEGGQCLLLPEQAQGLIISALQENQIITITVGRYESVITSYNFCELYRKFISD